MHPAVKFFQRFQAGLLADVISSLVWTLAGDQQCTTKLPEKCGARGREGNSDLAHRCEKRIRAGALAWLDRCLLSSRLYPGLDSSLWVFVQQPCRWTGPGRY